MKDKKKKTLSALDKSTDKKYVIIMDERGSLSLYMVIHVAKELKTFLLQLRGDLAR